MKLNPRVTELALYDIKGGPGTQASSIDRRGIEEKLTCHQSRTGVAADIGHINTKSTVTGYTPDANGLHKCLEGSEIVLIPAGVPRKPGMTRDGSSLSLILTHQPILSNPLLFPSYYFLLLLQPR